MVIFVLFKENGEPCSKGLLSISEAKFVGMRHSLTPLLHAVRMDHSSWVRTFGQFEGHVFVIKAKTIIRFTVLHLRALLMTGSR